MEDLSIFKYKLELIIMLLTILGIFIRVFIKFSKFVKYKFENLYEIKRKIEKIYAEVTPNGGGSIKDKVNELYLDIKNNNDLTNKIFQRQRWLLDHVEDPIFECDLDGKFIWVNKKFRKLLKRDMSYFLSNGWRNAIHEDDRDRVIHEWNSSITDCRSFDDEFRIISSTGEVINISVLTTKLSEYGYMGNIKILDISSDDNT